MADTGAFQRTENGILLPEQPVRHRNEEYDPAGFDVLRQMQARHFWYQGRHRFLLSAVKRFRPLFPGEALSELKGVDLGGGCGGWVRYLQTHAPHLFSELALADSSLRGYSESAKIPGIPQLRPPEKAGEFELSE